MVFFIDVAKQHLRGCLTLKISNIEVEIPGAVVKFSIRKEFVYYSVTNILCKGVSSGKIKYRDIITDTGSLLRRTRSLIGNIESIRQTHTV